jgi:hypothetical protein
MLLLPVRGTRLDWGTRLDPFEGQGFQFFYPLLISLNKPLEVGFDTEPFSLRSCTDLGFDLGMYWNVHIRTVFLALMVILRPATHSSTRKSR